MMREIGRGLDDGKAALFVLVRKATMDKVLMHLERHPARVLRTSLSKELEEKLRAAVEPTNGQNVSPQGPHGPVSEDHAAPQT
jgi:uncharacterized membrane protein